MRLSTALDIDRREFAGGKSIHRKCKALARPDGLVAITSTASSMFSLTCLLVRSGTIVASLPPTLGGARFDCRSIFGSNDALGLAFGGTIGLTFAFAYGRATIDTLTVISFSVIIGIVIVVSIEIVIVFIGTFVKAVPIFETLHWMPAGT